MNSILEKVTDPRISIVMSTYNRAELLREALESMICLDPPAYEIVVIDDGSSDHTVEVLQVYSPHIVFEQRRNAGKSSAINHAVNLATGDWIWICDDDDRVLTNAIKIFTEGIETNPSAGFVYSNYGWLIKDSAGLYEQKFSNANNLPRSDEIKASLLMGLWIPYLWSLTIKRDIFISLGGLREDLRRVEDEDFALRMVRTVPGVPTLGKTYLFRHHDGYRGAGKFQFDNTKRETVDINFLKLIYKDVYKNFSVQDYYSDTSEKFNLPTDPLIIRMLTMFRVCLWDEACDDYLQLSKRTLSSQESESFTLRLSLIVAGLTAEKTLELINSKLIVAIKTTASPNYLGRQFIIGFVKGTYWSMVNEAKNQRFSQSLLKLGFLILFSSLKIQSAIKYYGQQLFILPIK